MDQNVAINAASYAEQSHEEITSDISRDSFMPEQLPEASIEIEQTRPVSPRRIQTRTQTALDQRLPRRRFSHFGCPSDSEPDQETAEQLIPEADPPMVLPELDDLEPLFSDHEEIPPEPPRSLIPSSSGTSALLLSIPALTDTLSNFPLFSSHTGCPSDEELSVNIELEEERNREEEPNQELELPPLPDRSTGPSGRRRG